MKPTIRRLLWTFGLVAFGLLVTARDGVAQGTGTIQGTITDARTGRALVGVQVQVVGTRFIVVTDRDGQYSMVGIPVGSTELRVTRIGFSPATQSLTITLNSTATQDFQLASSALELEGVVVTATGEQLRREVGNTIATINVAEDVDQASIRNLADLVTGRAAGVTVLASGGTIGSGTRIRIRGSNSVSLANDPVIYVDGIRVSNATQSFSLLPGSVVPLTGGQSPSRLNDIDPEQINPAIA